MGSPEQGKPHFEDILTGVVANFGESPSDVALITRYQILSDGRRNVADTYYARRSTFGSNKAPEVLTDDHPEVLAALGRFATAITGRRSA
jgi:hypothetical protein